MAGSCSVKLFQEKKKTTPPKKNTKLVVHLKFFPSVCIHLYVTCGRGAVVQKDFKNLEITSNELNTKVLPLP